MKKIIILIMIILLATLLSACEKRDISEDALSKYFEEMQWTDLAISDNNRYVPSNISKVTEAFDKNADYGNNHNKMQVVFGELNGISMIAFVSDNAKTAINCYEIPFDVGELLLFAENNVPEYSQYTQELMVTINEQADDWGNVLEYSKGVFLRITNGKAIEYIVYNSEEGFKVEEF